MISYFPSISNKNNIKWFFLLLFIPENGMCCVVVFFFFFLQKPYYVCILWPDTSDFSMKALSYTLLSKMINKLQITSYLSLLQITLRTVLVCWDCKLDSLPLGQRCSQKLVELFPLYFRWDKINLTNYFWIIPDRRRIVRKIGWMTMLPFQGRWTIAFRLIISYSFQAEDEQEKFERLQMELLMNNPQSAAYFSAQMRTARRVNSNFCTHFWVLFLCVLWLVDCESSPIWMSPPLLLWEG